jgi:hypothetical protein
MIEGYCRSGPWLSGLVGPELSDVIYLSMSSSELASCPSTTGGSNLPHGSGKGIFLRIQHSFQNPREVMPNKISSPLAVSLLLLAFSCDY